MGFQSYRKFHHSPCYIFVVTVYKGMVSGHLDAKYKSQHKNIIAFLSSTIQNVWLKNLIAYCSSFSICYGSGYRVNATTSYCRLAWEFC